MLVALVFRTNLQAICNGLDQRPRAGKTLVHDAPGGCTLGSRGIVHEHFRVQLKQPKRFLARDWKHAGFLFFGFSPATGSTPGFSSCGFE